MSDEVVVRDAATLLVVRDDPFEVLMLRRHAGATFPSAVVFPGGVVEPDDHAEHWRERTTGGDDLDPEERALRIAAVRETWEESGILAAFHGAPGNADRSQPFAELTRGGRIALEELHYFAHWITPAVRPKRFDTRFFLTRAPESQIAEVDGSENVELEWIGPRAALERNDSLMFPTRLNLARLAESETVDQAIAAASARPRFTVLPVFDASGGSPRILIPAEAGYGVTEGRP
jgi:8-oxo-dGTP pyrophosphatase MutT (NUDIX family)